MGKFPRLQRGKPPTFEVVNAIHIKDFFPCILFNNKNIGRIGLRGMSSDKKI